MKASKVLQVTELVIVLAASLGLVSIVQLYRALAWLAKSLNYGRRGLPLMEEYD